MIFNRVRRLTWQDGLLHLAAGGRYTQHGSGGTAGRRSGASAAATGSLWGRPRSAACVTRRMFGCRTDPIVKTIEHCFGGDSLVRWLESRDLAPPRTPRARGTGHASVHAHHPRCRTSDDGSTTASRPGVPLPAAFTASDASTASSLSGSSVANRRATILSVPVFATTWGLLAARPPPPDTRWPLWRGARCGASLR